MNQARQGVLIHNATVLFGDQRTRAIDGLLRTGAPDNDDERFEALCTAVGLLSFPRASGSRQPCVEGENAPRRVQDGDIVRSLQPQLRRLIAELLN